MFNLKFTDSCKPFFSKHKILTLPCLYIMEAVVFVKNNPQLFPRLSDHSERSRRDNNRLRMHSAKTVHMGKSIFCMAPILFNKIPNTYKTLNINSFKQKAKDLLINKTYYSVQEFLNDKAI